MKTKNLFATALLSMALLFSVNNTATAQRPSQEEMQARRAQMVEQQAERLAKDLDLKGDQKTSFVATYKTYQNELMATMQGQRGQRQEGQQEKKKLSDEEAHKQLDEYFARQESQIAQQQKRLEVERKYYAEFKNTLTPQQLVKVFRQRQGGQRQGFGQYIPLRSIRHDPRLLQQGL